MARHLAGGLLTAPSTVRKKIPVPVMNEGLACAASAVKGPNELGALQLSGDVLEEWQAFTGMQ